MRPFHRRASYRLGITLLLLAAGVPLATCRRAEGAGHEGLLAELERADLTRSIGPRLSVTTAYRPCSLRSPDVGTIPVTECTGSADGAAPSEGVLALASRASRAAPGTADPDTLHAIALVDLLWADAGGNSLHRSISYLETAARLSDRPAPVLADLAAAFLVRAERRQTPRDLLEAVEVAEQALEADSLNVAARFNLALALDRLGLDGEAAREWERFLMVDAKSGWAGEAKARVRRLKTTPVAPRRPREGATPAEVADFATRWPQEARLWGWDHLLGEWGDAVLAGDMARAGERLRLARTVGEALERRGGDATLADAVRAIRAGDGDERATRGLAEGHREYQQGRSAFLGEDNALASERFVAVRMTRPPSLALVGWARMWEGATLVRGGRLAEAESMLQSLLVEVDTVRSVALSGAVSAALGTALLRGGRYEPALDAFGTAVRRFDQAGETELLAGAQYLSADAAFALGATSTAYAWVHQALTTFRTRPRSVWLHTLLAVSAEEVAVDGLLRTARRIQDEGVAVAERTDTIHLVEARLKRALLAAAVGDTSAAAADVRVGEFLVPRLSSERARKWFRTNLRLARAASLLHSHPARAAADMDSILERPEETGTVLRLLRALMIRSEARLALGNSAGGIADLDSVTAVLGKQRDAVESARFRATLANAATGVVDRLVMLSVRAGEPAAALEHLERGRASFSPAQRTRVARASGQIALPPGHVAVEYAVIGDTLLIWTINGSDVHLARLKVDRERLERTIASVRASLEARSPEAQFQNGLAELYDLLIGPVEGFFGRPDTRLVLVPDGPIASVPFAALYDAVRQQYLVQTRTVSVQPSIRDAAAGPRPPTGDRIRALLVADPAFDQRDHPGLSRLQGALDEVREVAATYPDRIVLAAETANRPLVEAELHNANLLHFAGHAVFDDQRPDRSFLVLAPTAEGGASSSGIVAAADLDGMDLGHVRLVVLSACQTLRSGGGRSGGFAGFAGALLDADAGGVVGSAWKVDDELTRVLMVEFHRAYRESGDAPGALRAAQLRLLRSSDPALRSPAAWAGFSYAGH